MNKRDLQEIERKNNMGYEVSPVEVANLVRRVRLLESVVEDRLNYDYAQVEQATKKTKGRKGISQAESNLRVYLVMFAVAVVIAAILFLYGG